jgi:hypothetical protein
MRPLNKTVVCKPIEQDQGIIIYTEEYNKKCVVLHSDPKNIVKEGHVVIIDPRVAIDFDSENSLYFLHEYAIKAVII